MIPGLGGRLISEAVLERRLVCAPTDSERASELQSARRHATAAWRRAVRVLGPASSLLAISEVGAEPVLRALGLTASGTAIAHSGVLFTALQAGGYSVGLVVSTWGQSLDSLWRTAVVLAHRHGMAWICLFNGTRLRLVSADRLHSRRFADFELDDAIEDERAFEALWMTLGARGFASSPPAVAEIVRETDQHASSVCRSLRDGVLEASTSVLRALVGKRTPVNPDASFEQSLTIVYRILFLLFAEARELLPIWHAVYRDSYSIEALREAAERPGPAPGLWDALGASSRLAHAGCEAGDLRVSAFNGRLFAPSRTPLAERVDLDDEDARTAVLALTTRLAPDREGRERITYRDLGVEQIGGVYESLLDYEPRFKPTVSLHAGSGRRKSTGTFYTPQALADFLVRKTLAPLAADASAEQILDLKVVDPAMGSGAFLVAAGRYLAGAYETALVRDGRCHPADLGPDEQALIFRTVAERCLYGVDINPMAVQLARLSLWLATLAIDRPLSFLDHHLVVGDSLVGAWVASLRRSPVNSGRRLASTELPLFSGVPAESAIRLALPVRFTLSSEPNDTVAQVREKERAFSRLTHRESLLSRWKRVADLWCAHSFSSMALSSAFGALSDLVLEGRTSLPGHTARACLEEAEAIAARRRFLHWELEFPEVFFDALGRRHERPGFDAVIGNPPWDMVRADAGDAAAREKARHDERGLIRFVRDAGAYVASPNGQINRYQLFVERAVALVRAGGRVGLVLPSGAIADHGSAPLRRFLFSRSDVDSFTGFDNRRAIFPVHRSLRFVLMTATGGGPTHEIRCRLGQVDLASLASEETENGSSTSRESDQSVRLTPAILERLSGPEMAVPDLRAAIDLRIAERAAALYPPLGSADGWSAEFGRDVNATDDRAWLRPRRQGLPVIGGRHIEPFRALVSKAEWSISSAIAARRLGDRHRRPRLAYRDVAGAANRLTFIAAVLPAGCVATHTVFCLRPALPLQAQHFLCALFNSLVVNYLVRLRVTTHVTTAIVERLPIPKASRVSAFREIAAIGKWLSRRHDPHVVARLNAHVAAIYGLSQEEFLRVLGTFPLVPSTDRELAARAYRDMRAARP